MWLKYGPTNIMNRMQRYNVIDILKYGQLVSNKV